MSVIPLRRPQTPHVGIPRGVKIGLGALVFGLIILGQILALVRAYQTGATAPLPVPHTGTLRHRMNVVLAAALGPSDRGVRRFHIDSITPAPKPGLKVVTVTWAINNDLTWGTLGNGAQVDAYIILRTLYGAHFPIALVRLIGTYPTQQRQDTAVMRLSLSRKVDRTLIQAGGWSLYDAGAVWPLIHHTWINPDFQPQSAE